jgi:MATE family multidrug resistance protein
MARLAWPVATAELGWMAMGLVDTMMVGRVSAEAIGAVSIGSHVFFAIAIFGMGMLLGLDYLVAHAFGAGRLADARRALVQGVYLSALLSVVLTGVVLAVLPRLSRSASASEIARETVPYLRALLWSLLPLLLYGDAAPLPAGPRHGARRHGRAGQRQHHQRGSTVLVFGNLGFPAMGPRGPVGDVDVASTCSSSCSSRSSATSAAARAACRCRGASTRTGCWS